MNTSSRNTSLNSGSPSMCARGRISTPGLSIGEQEIRDPAMPWSAAGAGEQDRVRCQLGAAGPDLLALDAPAAVHLGCGGTQRGQVGARLRLGEQLAPELVAGEDRSKVALVLVRGAELDDRGTGEVLADDVEPFRRTCPIEFLVEYRAQLGVHAAAAVLLRPGQAGIPGVVKQPLPGAPIVELVLEACGFGSAELRQRVLQATHAPRRGIRPRRGCLSTPSARARHFAARGRPRPQGAVRCPCATPV